MSKAAEKRKTGRAEFLKDLAEKDPEKFRKEWWKRLSSWTAEAQRRASALHDADGFPMEAAAEIVEMAIAELRRCGPRAFDLAFDQTMSTMNHEVARAIAANFDTRLYRIGNTGSNIKLMKSGSHRPPR